jgi:hypothetical protein
MTLGDEALPAYLPLFWATTGAVDARQAMYDQLRNVQASRPKSNPNEKGLKPRRNNLPGYVRRATNPRVKHLEDLATSQEKIVAMLEYMKSGNSDDEEEFHADSFGRMMGVARAFVLAFLRAMARDVDLAESMDVRTAWQMVKGVSTFFKPRSQTRTLRILPPKRLTKWFYRCQRPQMQAAHKRTAKRHCFRQGRFYPGGGRSASPTFCARGDTSSHR